MHARNGRTAGLALIFAIVSLASAAAGLAQQPERERPRPQRAQNQEPGAARESEERRRSRAARERRPGRPDANAERGPERREPDEDGRFGGLPFWPEREDFGPLRPGEDAELLEFAEAEVPEAFLRLDRIRRNEPGQFRQRLRDAAPRLRFLRRVFQRNPDLGRVLVQHIDTSLAIQRLVRTFQARRNAANPRENARELQELRRRLRPHVQARFELEERALDLHVTELVATREARAGRRVQALLAPDADLSDVVDDVRLLAEQYRSADDPAARACLEVQISDRVLQQLDAEIGALRERLARSREDRDARIEHYIRRRLRE